MWSAAQLEMESGSPYRDIFLNLLHNAGYQERLFYTNASENIELVCFESPQCMLLSAYFITDADKIDRMLPFDIAVQTKPPKCVTLLRTGAKIDFIYKDGYTHFKTDILHIFDMYKIDFENERCCE